MSMWRCPHCGTPQAEASRCWVCRRSSTTCSTCRHFRRGVAAQLGYCGLDGRRLPLAGTEMRGCWEPAAARQADPPVPAAGRVVERAAEPSVRLRDFVPVELRRDHRIVVVAHDPGDRRADPEPTEVISAASAAAERAPVGPTLFGDQEV